MAITKALTWNSLVPEPNNKNRNSQNYGRKQLKGINKITNEEVVYGIREKRTMCKNLEKKKVLSQQGTSEHYCGIFWMLDRK